ncbi:zinc carboxypeptidase [bacterium BMS3Abin04]|nr:zinc carboxypeptidase [bacterium BMS3Abin04]
MNYKNISSKFSNLLFFIITLILIPTMIYPQVKFDADFESGNLKTVTTTDSVHYTVTTNEDIGGRWFYFRISGVKNKLISVEVSNSDVSRAMYSYDNKSFSRFTEGESPQVNVFEKTYEQNTVFVAYYTPYTFNYLQHQIKEWEKSPFVTIDTIGFTPKNLPLQEMKITDTSVPDSSKLKVWIHARTHPGETPSSWHFDGIVQELLSNSDVVNYYLSKVVFYMVPFVNPDGVYYGRSRTNFEGIDLESNWDKIDSETAEEVKILKQRLIEVNSDKIISDFLNMHSQASSYCTFWIHTPGTTSDFFYSKEYQFANLNASDNPYFAQEDFNESTLKSKFPEGWLWNRYGSTVMALTYETPYNNYLKSSNDLEVTNENLFEIGKRTVFSIAEYLGLSHPKRMILDNKEAIVNGAITTKQTGREFYGDNYYELPTTDTSAYTLFSSDHLAPSSRYTLYGWWQTDPNYSYETKFIITTNGKDTTITKTQRLNGGQWNYLDDLYLTNSDQVSIKVKANSTGSVVADAFRLVYVSPILSVEENPVINSFQLFQNYPNPFNPTTTIKYSIPSVETQNLASVQLKIYNILGEEVVTLVDQEQAPGIYKVTFDASRLASGTYIYQLQIDGFRKAKKMMLVK